MIPFIWLAICRADDDDVAAQESQYSAKTGGVRQPPWDSIYAGIQAGFQQVRPIFQRACFNCHTDQTRYPWYHQLPGVRALIDSDIRKARKRLDMSKGFPFVGHARPADNLVGIKEQITEGEMPPWEYRLMHWDAKPSRPEVDSIVGWIDQSLRVLAAHGQFPLGQPDLVPNRPADISSKESH